MVKIINEVLAVAAQEENAHGLDLAAELNRTLDFIETFIHIVNMQRIMDLVGKSLNVFNKLREKFVGTAFYNYKYSVGTLLLELLCVGVELKTALLGGAQNYTARRLAYAWLTVENPGHGCHAISCFLCQVLNSHKISP